MEQILINLVAGALGGVGAGKSSPTFDLGMIGNIISGLVGGGVLGQIVTLLLPSLMAAVQSGDVSIGGIMVLHTTLATELFPTAFRSTAAGVREAVATVGASAGLWILGLLYGATGSHAASITWILLVTPIAPIVLLFVPETARRELEEIAPDEVPAG